MSRFFVPIVYLMLLSLSNEVLAAFPVKQGIIATTVLPQLSVADSSYRTIPAQQPKDKLNGIDFAAFGLAFAGIALGLHALLGISNALILLIPAVLLLYGAFYLGRKYLERRKRNRWLAVIAVMLALFGLAFFLPIGVGILLLLAIL